MTKVFLEASGTARTDYEIKKSRFIANALPATTREEALSFLDLQRHALPDARHHCWAYLLGDPANSASAGFSDDGEPRGTAGKPILSALQYAGVSNVILVVTRYFGGIKLGAGGLTRAYGAAARELLAVLPTVIHIEYAMVSMSLNFGHEPAFRRWLEAHGGKIETIEYQQDINVQLLIPEEHRAEFDQFAMSKGIQI